jgi:DeoR family fructose operon transcriptional repressor
MKAAERQIKIREMLESRSFLDLESLCREFDASESSIRRDLDVLEREHVLRRVYGGAVPVSAPGGNGFDYEVQRTKLGDEKSRIANVAARLIQDGQTVILDGGSTAAAVARELANRSLHVVTNSLPIAEALESKRGIALTLTGGYLDPRIRVMLGPYAEQMLSAVRADVLVMGIGSITEAELSNNNTLVVGSERKMIEVAKKVIIVADHTKFGRGAMIPVAPLEAAHLIVSDSGLSPEYQETIRSRRIELLLA